MEVDAGRPIINKIVIRCSHCGETGSVDSFRLACAKVVIQSCIKRED
jgi:hypothetical protein